jgi:hypothetical protein
MQYLYADPGKIKSALAPLYENIKKIDPLTGKISEEFKTWNKLMGDLDKKNFSNLEKRLGDLKALREKGMMGDSEFKKVFDSTKRDMATEIYKSFEGDRGIYTGGRKEFDAAAIQKVTEKMTATYGEDRAKEIAELIEEIKRLGQGSFTRGMDLQALGKGPRDYDKDRYALDERMRRGTRDDVGTPLKYDDQTARAQMATIVNGVLKPIVDEQQRQKAEAAGTPEKGGGMSEEQIKASVALTDEIKAQKAQTAKNTQQLAALPEQIALAVVSAFSNAFAEMKGALGLGDQKAAPNIEVNQNVTFEGFDGGEDKLVDLVRRALSTGMMQAGIGNG